MTCLLQHRRAAIVEHARQWLGTPYHHQASRVGVGVDCIGLVRGVWRSLYGREPEALPGYSRDWSEATGRETLIDAARRHFVEVAPIAVAAGDILVFRYRPGAVAKHVGILAHDPIGDAASGHGDNSVLRAGAPTAHVSFIHAMEGVPVCEVVLTGWWRRRIAAAFQFPGVID
ncbi:MAG: NlpC/P60 family protein [Hyphomicrobiaceae bacterium]